MDSETKAELARRLLERTDVLRDPSDLDLLVFFVKHPHTLMASEQLAAFLGYELKRIAKSLDVLLGAGLLSRTQHSTHAARMFVFFRGDSGSGWLTPLLELAVTRDGRLALRRALQSRAAEGPAAPVASLDPEAGPPIRRTYLFPRTPPSTSEDSPTPKAKRKGNQR